MKVIFRPMRFLVLVFILLGFGRALAQTEAVQGVPIFDTPDFAESEGLVGALTRAGAHDRAEQALEHLIRKYPGAPRLQVKKAELAITRGDPDKALNALAAARSLGLSDFSDVVASSVFAPLSGDERLQALLSAPAAPLSPATFAPKAAVGGWAEVTPGNTRWEAPLARLRSVFTIPPKHRDNPAFSDTKKAALAELNQLVRKGAAAGNFGDFYDNRDADHSVPPDVTGTQVTRTIYGAEATERGVHYGLNEGILFSGPTFGNSSTALKGAGWRSQPRHALTTQFGPLRAWQLYDNNHVYVYPEHRDHDPDNGDLFPANTPMMLISQGSSGSDKGLLQAVQAILAAFRPEVKAFLTEHRLIAPTVQQILRRGMAGVESEDDYLSPKAHPTVFDQANVRLDRMIRLAYALEASAAPPRARLSVAAAEPSQGPFAAIMDEKLFATPDAAAYLWRGGGRTRVFQLSAAGSRDANGRPLTYLWRIIRGDPTKISINRSSANAETIELSVDWHDQTTSPGGLKSSRVDIALFAYNGVAYSAPAFFSLAFPGHQIRTYPEDRSDGRPLSITYGPTPRGVYFDPVLWPIRNWTDEFTYADGGQLTGWTRIYKRGRKGDFTRDGLMVHSRDDAGRPLEAERITYGIKRPKGVRMVMTETRTGQIFRYEYTGPNDVIGRAVASN